MAWQHDRRDETTTGIDEMSMSDECQNDDILVLSLDSVGISCYDKDFGPQERLIWTCTFCFFPMVI